MSPADVSTGGAISTDFTVTILVSVVGFLITVISGLVASRFISTLKGIEMRMDRQDKRMDTQDDKFKEHASIINKITTNLAIMEERHKNLGVELGEHIVAQLRAITPSSPDPAYSSSRRHGQ